MKGLLIKDYKLMLGQKSFLGMALWRYYISLFTKTL